MHSCLWHQALLEDSLKVCSSVPCPKPFALSALSSAEHKAINRGACTATSAAILCVASHAVSSQAENAGKGTFCKAVGGGLPLPESLNPIGRLTSVIAKCISH